MCNRKIVAIASSTGGPKALQRVVPRLPEDLNVPVLVVQHMPAGFTASLAQRLNGLSKVAVEEAEEGMPILDGHVYIAKGGKHLAVKKNDNQMILTLTDEEMREGVKPCANYMYESLADSIYDEIVCVVMAGMGSDGTEGIANLKTAKKVKVIAQDQPSCTIYGMPKSVVKAGLSDMVVGLDQLADTIVACVNGNERA